MKFIDGRLTTTTKYISRSHKSSDDAFLVGSWLCISGYDSLDWYLLP